MASTHFWQGFLKSAALKEVATVALFSVSDRKMLMGKRRDNQKWTNPGGHLEKGEAPLAGAVREVKEETGLDLGEDDLVKLKTKTVTKINGEKIRVHAFKAFLGGQKPKATSKHDPDNEVSVWRWIKTRGGLPRYISKNLHVPLKDNVLLSGLRLHKTAAHRRMPIDREAFDKLFREAMQQYARGGYQLPGRGGAQPNAGQRPGHEKRAAVSRLESLRRRRGLAGFTGDRIPGGLADDIPPEAFDRRAVAKGQKVELEHTSSRPIAAEIARDHLTEDPRYYEKLEQVEKKGGARQSDLFHYALMRRIGQPVPSYLADLVGRSGRIG